MPILKFVKNLIGKRHRIGLALSSGGAKGFAHIGILKVLEEACIPIHCIVGTSAGAVIGSLYTSGMPIKDIEDLAADLNLRDMARLFFPTFGRSGFIDGNRVKNFLAPYLKDKRIEDLNPKFACVAADLLTGERIVFKKGNVLEAVRASSSIPGIFTPLNTKEHILVDGGIVDPLPIDLAYSLGATYVIAVNVNLPQKSKFTFGTSSVEVSLDKVDSTVQEESSAIKKAVHGLFHRDGLKEKHLPTSEIIFSAITILEAKLLQLQLKQAGPHLLVQPDLSKFEVHSFRRGKEIIEAGYKAMKDALPRLLMINFRRKCK
ncbi:patatin-like phospholipase family protein [bacterium]|nr:patatin-like phospholipase family protein [bacterium]